MDMLFLSPMAQVVPSASPSALGCGGRFFWEADVNSLESLFNSSEQVDPLLLLPSASALPACAPLTDDASLMSSLFALECESAALQTQTQSQLAPALAQLLQQTQQSQALQEATANIIEWPAHLLSAAQLPGKGSALPFASPFTSPFASFPSSNKCPFDRMPGQSSVAAQASSPRAPLPAQIKSELDVIDFDLLDNLGGSDTSSISEGSHDSSHDLYSSTASFPSAKAGARRSYCSESTTSSDGRKVHGGSASRKSSSSGNPPPKRKRCPIMARKSRLERKRRHQMIVEHSTILADTNKRLNAEFEGLAREIASLKAKVLQRLTRGSLALPIKISSTA